MYKKCKVVMLPTNEKSKIHIHPKGIMYSSIEEFVQDCKEYKSYHLYIFSNEEIKEGDYRYSENLKDIKQVKGIIAKEDSGFYKIIATTDDSVPYPKTKPALAQIPNSFIEKFVEEYNKDNIITEVMVEYDVMNKGYDKPKDFPYQECKMLKINSDNTINIKLAKDSWTREEVISLCQKAAIIATKSERNKTNFNEDFLEFVETEL